jgi:hypothetical protein
MPTVPHVLNYGMGVDSTAILLRWLLEPESRPCDVRDLVVISAQTGDEFDSTKQLVESHIFPLLRQHQVRTVQVAKHGALTRDGYTILNDTPDPRTLFIDGDYRMSTDLHKVGTVPRYSGAHTCAVKWKGVVLDDWFRDHLPPEFIPYLGYNAEEQKRADKCEEYTSQGSSYRFPLIEWGWSRQDCLDYIQDCLGVDWKKSSCMYCPFISKEAAAVRYLEEPESAGFTLFTESVALALNPRMQLFSHGTAYDLMIATGNTPALENYRQRLALQDWGLYRVERIWEHKIGSSSGKPFVRVDRRVVQLHQGDQEGMVAALQTLATEQQLPLETSDRIHRVYSHRRNESEGLSCEGFWTICPATVEDKVRNPKDFQQKWDRASGSIAQLNLFQQSGLSPSP